MSVNFEVHPPNSGHPSLSRENFDVKLFMGTWHVVHSSLPLWKDKKDVTITYEMIGSPDDFYFNDIVEYRKKSKDAANTSRTKIVGVDRLVEDVPPGAPEGYRPGASYKWRGKGWLVIASSKWQALGYRDDIAVTYFAKTLFTPAGIDIYSRSREGIDQETYDSIVEQLKGHGGDVGKLALDLFEIERSPEGSA